MKSIILSFFQNRELIAEMAKRDLKMINKGAFLGYIWLILSPLIQTAAYVIIVSFVFRSSLGEGFGKIAGLGVKKIKEYFIEQGWGDAQFMQDID